MNDWIKGMIILIGLALSLVYFKLFFCIDKYCLFTTGLISAMVGLGIISIWIKENLE